MKRMHSWNTCSGEVLFSNYEQFYTVSYLDNKHIANLVGLIVGHQLVDGCSLGDLQQHRFGLLPSLRYSRTHVAQVAGAGTLTLAGAVHADACSHSLCTCVQETGNVCRVGQRPRLLVTLLRLLGWRVT